MESKVFTIEQYEENYEMQISEVEILQSMFSGPGELDVDVGLIHSVVDWVNDNGKTKLDRIPSPIDFCVKLCCGRDIIEVAITLPPEYPKILPEIYVRSNKLSRESQTAINEDIGEYLENETILEEPCVAAVISWLQEHSESYFTSKQETVPVKSTESSSCDPRKFARHWIYCHHIYSSKEKRRNLTDLALECNLSGFCLPGKPGVICVEGRLDKVAEWWTVVRNWNWKKITVKIQEEEEISKEGSVDASRLFTGFQEIGTVKECQRGNHMDMGEFYKYLEVHQRTWVFKELFGIEKS